MQVDSSDRSFGSLGWFILCVLLAVVCRSEIASAATKVVTDADKGGQVRLRLGDTLELRLPANSSRIRTSCR